MPLSVDHAASLTRDLRHLSAMRDVCDVTFVVDGDQQVHAVRALLAIRSRVFYKLLYGPKSAAIRSRTKFGPSSSSSSFSSHTVGRRLQQLLFANNTTGTMQPTVQESTNVHNRLTITIDDFDVDVFRLLIDYAQSGAICVHPNTVIGLMNAADHYGLKELRTVCVDYAHSCIRIESICTLLMTAERYVQYKLSKLLLQKMLEFIDTNAEQFFQLTDFLQLSAPIVQLIVSRDELNASELTKLRAIQRWTAHVVGHHPSVSTADVYRNLLPYIALHEMPPSVLMAEIRPLDIISDDELMAVLAYQIDPNCGRDGSAGASSPAMRRRIARSIRSRSMSCSSRSAKIFEDNASCTSSSGYDSSESAAGGAGRLSKMMSSLQVTPTMSSLVDF